MLGYMLFRSGLVPPRFALFGIVAGSLALATAVLVLFGAYDQVSAPSFFLTLPEGVWELSLGFYLILKGFRPNASLFEHDRRETVRTTSPSAIGESAVPAARPKRHPRREPDPVSQADPGLEHAAASRSSGPSPPTEPRRSAGAANVS